MAQHGIRDRVADRRHGLHAASASTGTRAPTTCSIDAVARGARPRPASTLDDVDAFWLGTLGSGQCPASRSAGR